MTSPLTEPCLHFEVIARPNVEQFIAKPDDLRLAVNAILTLDAVAGYMYTRAANHDFDPFYVNDGELRRAFARQSEPMAHLRDMANARKHSVLTGSMFVASASEIEKRRLGWDVSLWDQGRWDSPGQLCFDNPSGGIVIVKASIALAMVFFQNELIDIPLQKESVSP